MSRRRRVLLSVGIVGASLAVAIGIQFDDGHVSAKSYFPPTETVPAKLRRWLGIADRLT